MSLNQEEEKYIEQLYREMYTRLCFYAKNALGSRTLAEEVVQDTFRIACIKPDSLMNSKNPPIISCGLPFRCLWRRF